MRRNVRVELWAAGLLALSLGAKVLLATSPPDPDAERFARDLAAAFAAHGYTTRIEPRQNLIPIVFAWSHGCVVEARPLTAINGDSDDNDRVMLSAAGPVEGLYPAGSDPSSYAPLRPRWGISIRLRLQRELARIGVHWPVAPVIAVAARPGCYPPGKWLSSLRILPRQR